MAVEWSYEYLNPGPLEEQAVHLTAEPSPKKTQNKITVEFKTVFLCSPGCPVSSSRNKIDLKVIQILLPLPPEC